jgi:hypothetical protein
MPLPPAQASGGSTMIARTVYGASPVNRHRSTKAELRAVDDAIIEAVETEHPVTLRGVFYRAVSAGAIEKTENGYDLIGRELLKLRRSGGIRYDWITDGTRWINKPDSYDDLDQMLEDAAASYRRALWRDQAAEVQIYSEKDAISGVILPVTQRWDVPLGIVRGYSSETFAWSVAQSIIEGAERGKDTHVYQLGDHDPSGVDAWRAFRKSVCGFLLEEHLQMVRRVAASHPEAGFGEPLDPDLGNGESTCVFTAGEHVATAFFQRLAVTELQIYELGLPTRLTKRSDSRAHGFDGGSVEVDAIPPTELRRIVEEAITQHIDPEALRLTQVAEQSERDILTSMISGQP